MGSLFGSSEQKIIHEDATFVHWFSTLQNLAMGVSNFGQEKWKQKERTDVVLKEKKRTIQIFTYELLIQNNNLSITNKYKLYVHTYKLNKTSARFIDNCFFFRANTTWGKMCEHHFFLCDFGLKCSHVRTFCVNLGTPAEAWFKVR